MPSSLAIALAPIPLFFSRWISVRSIDNDELSKPAPKRAFFVADKGLLFPRDQTSALTQLVFGQGPNSEEEGLRDRYIWDSSSAEIADILPGLPQAPMKSAAKKVLLARQDQLRPTAESRESPLTVEETPKTDMGRVLAPATLSAK